MNPFFFGTSERRLFGIYTPAQGAVASDRAALLCHPWGQEYIRAHRSLRHLASLLTRAGIHVLRFDYHGTGDSGGEITDGDLAGWQRDVETAMDELKDTTGATRVGLVGLRLGATLAGTVAAGRDDVDGLVLWDPVVSGEEYARELSQLASSVGSPSPPGTVEVLGFLLRDELLRELAGVDLVRLVPSLPPRTLVVLSQELPSHGALRAALEARQDAVLEEIAGEPPWVEERNTGVGALPVKVLQRIVQWWS